MNFLPAHMYANHVPGWYPWRSEEDVGSSKSGSRIVWAVVWMLRIGPRSFVKAPSALNNAVISPARHWVMCTHDQRSKTMLHICSGQQLERLRDMWQYYYKKKKKAKPYKGFWIYLYLSEINLHLLRLGTIIHQPATILPGEELAFSSTCLAAHLHLYEEPKTLQGSVWKPVINKCKFALPLTH